MRLQPHREQGTCEGGSPCATLFLMTRAMNSNLAGQGRLTTIGVLAGLLVICLGVGALGSVFTMDKIDTWYSTLAKPSFTPPNWVFGPVWTALYVAMAVAAWLAWRSTGTKRFASAGTLFGVQLVLNLAWSIAFFGAESPVFGLVVIAGLWVVLAGTIASFFDINRWAGALLVPYILWVSFAAALNFEIWRLN